VLAGPAHAGRRATALDAVDVRPPAGPRVSLASQWTDEPKGIAEGPRFGHESDTERRHGPARPTVALRPVRTGLILSSNGTPLS